MEEELNEFEKRDRAKVSSTNAKCINCGGNITFNPKGMNLLCPNCDSQFEFEKTQGQKKHYVNQTDEQSKEHEAWAKEMRLVKCKTCGAEVMLSGLELTSCCPYCGSDYVVEEVNLAGLKPDVVVPFAFNQDEAGDKFVQGMKKKFFAPGALKKKLPLDKIRGIYVPTFTFDADTFTRYKGMLSKTETHTDSKGRTHTTTKHIPISGTKSMQHRDYVVESSSKMNGKQMNALLPFNFENTYYYTQDFIRGFSLEHYEDPMMECHKSARAGMNERIKSAILSQYSYTSVEYLNMDTNWSEELYSYRILPIYSFEYTYKNKKYVTFMNGQTGKVGTGYPKSPLKITLVVFLALLVVAGIIALVVLTGGAD